METYKAPITKPTTFYKDIKAVGFFFALEDHWHQWTLRKFRKMVCNLPTKALHGLWKSLCEANAKSSHRGLVKLWFIEREIARREP